jgi:Cysteine-rich secretory protein family
MALFGRTFRSLVNPMLALWALSLTHSEPAFVFTNNTGQDKSFAEEMLKTHNAERAFQGRRPLQWDHSLAEDAAKWAAYLASQNRFEHAYAELTKTGQGENLWMGTRGAYPYQDMVELWLAERQYTKSGRFPDVSHTGNWADVGHFVQIIWPETQKVGCALKSSEQDDYLVCRYWPGGNRIGDPFIVRARN